MDEKVMMRVMGNFMAFVTVSRFLKECMTWLTLSWYDWLAGWRLKAETS
jgi:hypothetical protein